MKYYPDKDDNMWDEEVKSVLGYCYGLGLDVGAGNRTINPNMITIDNWSNDVDFQMEADKLKFKDNTFDFVYAGHVLEHLTDTLQTIKEWLRVVKIGGYVIIITPDKRFIPTKGSLNHDPQHKFDWQYEEIREIIKCIDECDIVNKNIWALKNYSLLFVLRKVK